MARDKQNESAAEGKLSGIGGWLILPAIGLVLAPIGLITLAVLEALSFGTDAFKELAAAHPTLPAYTWVSIIVYVGLLLYAGYVAYVFFGKREAAPRAYTTLLVTCIICAAGFTAWFLAIGLGFEITGGPYVLGMKGPGGVYGPLAAVLVCVLLILYFQRSKCVKATFVVPASDQETRWLAYGTNVVVALVLAAVVMVAAVWLSGSLLHDRVRSNWASGGSTHLSPRTKALLADLDSNVTLTNLYMEESSDVPNSADMRDMRRQVQNLLTEYADANPSRITVESIDPDVDQAGVESLWPACASGTRPRPRNPRPSSRNIRTSRTTPPHSWPTRPSASRPPPKTGRTDRPRPSAPFARWPSGGTNCIPRAPSAPPSSKGSSRSRPCPTTPAPLCRPRST